ncbi:MAG: hypothetical protein WD036_03885 [Bauldia sp.]
MSINKCLGNAVKGGEISKAEARELRARYEALKAGHDSAGAADAGVRAKAEFVEELTAQAAEKRRRAIIDARAFKNVKMAIGSYRTPGKRPDKGAGAIALLEHYGSAGYSSVVGRKKAITGMAHARMAELLERFQRTAFKGVTPDRAGLDNIVREAMGDASGDAAAKALAETWGEVAEWLRTRFNRAGGAVPKLENWGLPQSHKSSALLKAGQDTWKAAIRPRLDIAAMRHPLTGKPVRPSEIDGILDEIWATVVTDGWSKREPGRQAFGRGAISGLHAEHRFLKFKSADDWLAYARDFGEPDAFAAMMNHINLMARDIAALEILGPNPAAMVEFLKQTALKEGMERLAAGHRFGASRGRQKAAAIDGMWRTYRAASESPVNSQAAGFLAGMRNWVTASVLGSATLSAVPTDPMYQAIARRMSGLPAVSTLFDIASAFRGEPRRKAVRGGLILDSAMHVFSEQARYVGTLSGPQWTQWLADRVLTASGLTPWTQAARHAFGLEFMAVLADQAGRRFEEVSFARAFARYGLTAEDWNVIRATPADADGFLRPADVAARSETRAERLLEMILQETEYAVPSTTLRGRAAMVSSAQPGTVVGELTRSFAMFKSFGVTFAMLYGGRISRETAMSPARGAGYAGALLATTTLGGLMSVWLKDVAAGRDPRPLLDEDGSPLKTMAAAFLQGGGFGIWGDFLLADVNRYGGGFAGTLTGPIVERATDAWNLTAGNAIQLAAGEDTRFLEELRRFVGGNLPASTLWYWKLAYQRVALDQLEFMVDPAANRQFKARQTQMRTMYGTGSWWRPGQRLPERAPALPALAGS